MRKGARPASVVVTSAVALALALAGSACQGDIGAGPNGNPGPGPGPGGSGGTSGGNGAMDPGRVTAHRLNIREYNNTIRDLIGMDLQPATQFMFPDDEWGDGFNNDADVLTVSSLSVEKYLASAQSVIGKATATGAAGRARIYTCDPSGANETTCANQILTQFAKRAFRRPVTADEIVPYAGLITLVKGKGDSFDVGLQAALAGILTAPDFLYRVEIDPTPGQIRKLNDWEIASRLSYFIWASMPDDALFAAAEAGKLTQGDELVKQVQRMLADAKSSAFRDIMVEQWMQGVALPFAVPNAMVFPKWQASLATDMQEELRQFLGPILSGKAPASDLLTAKYAYANKSLGTFYGLANAASLSATAFSRVDVTDGKRGGILRQGPMLVLTSRPDRSSPTKRGKWILEKLLCLSPPPPPGAVPSLPDDPNFMGSQRQRLQQLHTVPGTPCAGCHSLTDPPGFALEHYDGVGLWRDKDGAFAIDATGTVPGPNGGANVSFDGAEQLAGVIAADPRYPACVAKQFLTYALGRHVTADDQAMINDIGARFAKANLDVPTLVQYVAQSPAMTQRHAE